MVQTSTASPGRPALPVRAPEPNGSSDLRTRPPWRREVRRGRPWPRRSSHRCHLRRGPGQGRARGVRRRHRRSGTLPNRPASRRRSTPPRRSTSATDRPTSVPVRARGRRGRRDPTRRRSPRAQRQDPSHRRRRVPRPPLQAPRDRSRLRARRGRQPRPRHEQRRGRAARRPARSHLRSGRRGRGPGSRGDGRARAAEPTGGVSGRTRRA